jgi:hypothetical protein
MEEYALLVFDKELDQEGRPVLFSPHDTSGDFTGRLYVAVAPETTPRFIWTNSSGRVVVPEAIALPDGWRPATQDDQPWCDEIPVMVIYHQNT